MSASAILSSEAAIRPMAVVTTSGLPPGIGANPPLASRHDLTYLTQPRTSGTEPPTCLSNTLQRPSWSRPGSTARPTLAANPPSLF